MEHQSKNSYYLIPSDELIQIILNKSAYQEDSITSFLNNDLTDLREARALNAALNDKEGAYIPVLNTVKIHPALAPLDLEERATFYHGCTQTMLVRSVLRGIYTSISKVSAQVVTPEISADILYLCKACRIVTRQDEITEGIFYAFSTTASRVEFYGRIRPLIFSSGDEYLKGKRDALATITSKLITTDYPIRKLALSSLGVWFQNKRSKPAIDEEQVRKAVEKLQGILEKLKKDDTDPLDARLILTDKLSGNFLGF